MDPTGDADGDALLSRPNAIGASLGLLGDEWTLLIVRAAFEGARRYGDWKCRLPISDAVLTARLATLVDAGVLVRVPAGDGASRHEYLLSRSGLDLWQLLLCIWDWERRHVAGQAVRLPSMVHATCGSAFHPTLRCSRCATVAVFTEIDAQFGPSGSFERSLPVGRTRRRPSSAGPSVGGTSVGPSVGPSVGRSGGGSSVGGASGRSGGASGPGLFVETMAVIGSRWSSAVLGAAFLGATRFRDFARIGAPPAIVSDRLRTFVELGVLDTTAATAATAATTATTATTTAMTSTAVTGEAPAYRLSAKGEAFLPVVVSFVRWGERWFPATDGPAVVAIHRTCGTPFVPELACSECDGALARRSVHIHADEATGDHTTAVAG